LNVSVKIPFEQVVQRHGGAVLRVCRAVVGPDEADDAWSETFLSALRGWPDLPDDANVEAWLVTIAHRRAVDVVRARVRRPLPVDELPEPHAAPGMDRDERSDLYAAVATLPDRQRHAVAYHHLMGLPHAEVAAVLGVTPDAARKAASDGVGALRRILKEES
jgi:RNA polymerase sigma factor (sigma-70 family)